MEPSKSIQWVIRNSPLGKGRDVLLIHKQSPFTTNVLLEPGELQVKAGKLNNIVVVIENEVLTLDEAYTRSYIDVFRKMSKVLVF